MRWSSMGFTGGAGDSHPSAPSVYVAMVEGVAVAEDVTMAVDVAMTDEVSMAVDKLSSSAGGDSSQGRSRCWWSGRCCCLPSFCGAGIACVSCGLLLLLVGGSLPALCVAVASRGDIYTACKGAIPKRVLVHSLSRNVMNVLLIRI